MWIAAAGALVFFMQAGFALLESGMSRAKNAINVIMKNYCDMCFGAIAFWAIGYGLMFGSNATGWFGTDRFFPGAMPAIDYAWLFFQTMFAATAATIVSGAIAERARFGVYITASMLVTGIVYPVFGAWAWGSLYERPGLAAPDGLHRLRRLDRRALGRRLVRARRADDHRPAHRPLRPGREGAHDPRPQPHVGGAGRLHPLARLVRVQRRKHGRGDRGHRPHPRQHASRRRGGAIGAIVALRLSGQPMLLTATVNGSIAGLVAITAGCAVMDPPFALLTGFVGGVVMVAASALLERFRVDDVVGAIAVHGFGGAWGTLAAGLFKAGALFDLAQVKIQAIGIGAAFLWAFPVSLAIWWLIDKVRPVRASTSDEQRGLDYSEHYEIGYPEFQRDALNQGKA